MRATTRCEAASPSPAIICRVIADAQLTGGTVASRFTVIQLSGQGFLQYLDDVWSAAQYVYFRIENAPQRILIRVRPLHTAELGQH